jgi:hypothetical protein
MNSLLTTLPVLLPIAYIWAEKQELLIMQEGTPLTESQLADARRAGVAQPEKIRVVCVETLPQPENEDFLFIAKRIGLFTPDSVGLAVGYGICLRHGSWDNRLVLVHQCVHVAQYEKLGGIRPFLNRYLRECIEPGYPFGRLEQEANLVSKDICKQPVAGERNDVFA